MALYFLPGFARTGEIVTADDEPQVVPVVPLHLISMATRDRVIHVTPDAYDRLRREAGRRGVGPDELADELLDAELAPSPSDLNEILADLAQIRSRVHRPVDAVALVREGREELDQRGR